MKLSGKDMAAVSTNRSNIVMREWEGSGCSEVVVKFAPLLETDR